MRTPRRFTEKKARGAHFTPPELAFFLATRVRRALGAQPGAPVKVLDPACGDGELLLAFARTAEPEALRPTTLIGVDADPGSVAKARVRLAEVRAGAVVLDQGDFLKMCESAVTRQPTLFGDAASHYVVDAIIANPPYVRTQVLGGPRARELAMAFNLTGRVDLYQAFLVAMTRCLVPGGVLGVITSNRFLTTRGGACTRALLSSEYEVLELFDLGDTRLFDAAVLPSVFVGRKRPHAAVGSRERHTAPFVRIYEAQPQQAQEPERPAQSVYSVLRVGGDGRYRIRDRVYDVASGRLGIPRNSQEPWVMVTAAERDWLAMINAHAQGTVGDHLRVRVGIKSCADDVFIRKDWREVPEALRPEPPLLRPLLSHDDASRWTRSAPDRQLRQVLYPHGTRSGKRCAIDLLAFPRTAAYLERYRDRLEGRKYVTAAGRQWFEIWVPQDPNAWVEAKIVFPDISAEPQFYYDGDGCVVDGNCYWMTRHPDTDPQTLFLILGLANSALMTRYHDLSFANKLYSGRRRYLTQYVDKYPVPDAASAPAQTVAHLATELVAAARDPRAVKDLEGRLEVAVAEAFGVEPVLTT